MIPSEPPGSPFPLTRNLRVLLSCLLLLGPLPVSAAQPKPPHGWRLAWSDDFNGPSGSALDPGRWTFEIGGEGFGNHELETYTGSPANAHQQNGNLVITALKQDLTGPDRIPRQYTSARIRSQDHFAQTYGRFEARIQLPLGKGIWPAFWLLGADSPSVDWPGCGEIDILENVGDPSVILSTIHGPGYSGAVGLSTRFHLPPGQAVNTAFHLYAVEWAPNDIKFFFDDHLIVHRTPAYRPPGARWVFDHPFFLILHRAVGGDLPGSPDASTTFPQRMLVDYVRVYTREPANGKPPAAKAGRR
ncbi:MAG: glycoside hydrolase family 16 protein [Acidobacteriaceae bacterium]